MSSTFSSYRIQNLEHAWRVRQPGFISLVFFATVFDQTVAWSALQPTGLKLEGLQREGPAFETSDGEDWAKFGGRSDKVKRGVVLLCLRFRTANDSGDERPIVKNDGSASRVADRRNRSRSCCSILEVAIPHNLPPQTLEDSTAYPVISSLRGFLTHFDSCEGDSEVRHPITKTMLPVLKQHLNAGKGRLVIGAIVLEAVLRLMARDGKSYRFNLLKSDLRRVRQKIILLKYNLDVTSGKSALKVIDGPITSESDPSLMENVFFYTPRLIKRDFVQASCRQTCDRRRDSTWGLRD